MALRVLLADESTTIKKVMQLALQDFAVEVKAVHAGIDVLEVARAFQPDLIFADVLLQKKNGYEVCALLKADAELKVIPVVLMWSSFMDLDDALARSSGADARLEKPFDVETLRKQVLELVPRTRSQRLAHFLDHAPKLNADLKTDSKPGSAPTPPAMASAPPTAPSPKPPAPPPLTRAASSVVAPSPITPTRAAPAIELPPPVMKAPEPAPASWSMESFEDPSTLDPSLDSSLDSSLVSSPGLSLSDEPLSLDADNGDADADDEMFKPLELSQIGRRPASPQDSASFRAKENPLEIATPEPDDENWSRQDLSQFRLDLPPISVGEGDEGFNVDLGDREFSTPSFSLDAEQIAGAEDEVAFPIEPLGFQDFQNQNHDHSFSQQSQSEPLVPQLSAERLEAIIRAQSREIIESVVRKMVPEIAASMIREELERLLEDTSIQDPRL